MIISRPTRPGRRARIRRCGESSWAISASSREAARNRWRGPPCSHVDLAYEVDAAGYDIHLAIAYWTDHEQFARWQASPPVADWWNSDARLDDGLGYFREILTPHVANLETLFAASDRLEGIGVLFGGLSAEPVQEHGYWGSMRDRLPRSQTDAMDPAGSLSSRTSSGRIRLAGHENVAVIRSGQDWTDTTGRERDMYLQEMEPILRKGMMFLRDHGRGIGCYANRYVQHIDATAGLIEKSFGISFWRSLDTMEKWAEFHPTHEAIFGTFMGIVGALDANLKLRLYHEVTVVTPDEQSYEYINCHPQTGLLAAVA
jgi:aldoxime dehydratase